MARKVILSMISEVSACHAEVGNEVGRRRGASTAHRRAGSGTMQKKTSRACRELNLRILATVSSWRLPQLMELLPCVRAEWFSTENRNPWKALQCSRVT